MVIPRASAALFIASRSSSSVVPASTAITRILAPAAASTVCIPITGTSKRKSCLGFDTFTITASLRPSAARHLN